jgi:C4-dicarboxylate-specific signal transduction histidine kinase
MYRSIYNRRMNEELSVFLNIVLLLSLVSLSAYTYNLYKKYQIKSQLGQFKNQSESEAIGNAKFSELGLMTAGIAHEINNSLAIIKGRLERLLKIYRDPDKQKELAEGLGQIDERADRIAKTIQEVRQYIYQDENDYDSAISLSELLDHVMLFFSQRLKNHGIDLKLRNIVK